MTSGVLDEKTIFNAARKIDSPENRAEYLHQACEGDHDLIHRIRTLLGAYEKQADILESPIVPPALDQLAEQIGSMIGLYELVEEIGEGGMGSVYMALQKEPVRRTVALKVIKPGMDTKQVVARFEAERQALAMMDHPNIARVFDGGATESGRPYFAMELVDGTPITDYSDCNQLTIRERLGLFGNICRAVQHAHQKGIIHRDLKPSNILVTQLDGEALPKIIDFGIAKATSGRLMDDSFATAVSQVVGTPMYMSPEQAALGGTDVDTRSDVYSLGVLLYKLLTGMPPFDADRMKAVSPDEFRRIIREEDPPKPSTRLSTLDAASETVADMHSTNPRELAQQVRGELDWIVRKLWRRIEPGVTSRPAIWQRTFNDISTTSRSRRALRRDCIGCERWRGATRRLWLSRLRWFYCLSLGCLARHGWRWWPLMRRISPTSGWTKFKNSERSCSAAMRNFAKVSTQ